MSLRVAVGVGPAPVFDRFADAGQGLGAVAGEAAGRVDEILVPGPAGQADGRARASGRYRASAIAGARAARRTDVGGVFRERVVVSLGAALEPIDGVFERPRTRRAGRGRAQWAGRSIWWDRRRAGTRDRAAASPASRPPRACRRRASSPDRDSPRPRRRSRWRVARERRRRPRGSPGARRSWPAGRHRRSPDRRSGCDARKCRSGSGRRRRLSPSSPKPRSSAGTPRCSMKAE